MNYYGECPVCGNDLSPIWFVEEQIKHDHGVIYKTGKKRNAVDYLICEYCGHKECVDDTFDGAWY